VSSAERSGSPRITPRGPFKVGMLVMGPGDVRCTAHAGGDDGDAAGNMPISVEQLVNIITSGGGDGGGIASAVVQQLIRRVQKMADGVAAMGTQCRRRTISAPGPEGDDKIYMAIGCGAALRRIRALMSFAQLMCCLPRHFMQSTKTGVRRPSAEGCRLPDWTTPPRNQNP
jgi:hypothetical protein